MNFALKLSGLIIYSGKFEEFWHDKYDFSNRRIPILVAIGTRHFIVVCCNYGEMRHFITQFNTDLDDVVVDLRPMSFDYPGAEIYSAYSRSISQVSVEKITPVKLCSYLRYEDS